MSIEVNQVSKSFGLTPVLKDISLKIKPGELVALLGPSGSGKTTLLRIIAGLEQADVGSVNLNGVDVTREPVARRKVGFVFQHYALFRHMNVLSNVAFGLTVRPRRERPSRADIKDRAMELLRLVQLDKFALRYPDQLSGGQRQRVALARALAVEPKVLLLDEPFGALDARVRRELRRWLRRLHDEMHITSVFVTHDQEEALEVADRVAVLNEGRIEQIGTPEEVYEHPRTPFVINFLGNVNLFHGRLDDQGQFDPHHQDQAHAVYVRPHELGISRAATGPGVFEVEVQHVVRAGPVIRLEARRCDNGQAVDVELTRDDFASLNIKPGERIFAHPQRLHHYEADYVI